MNEILMNYAAATDWKPIEPGSCSLCGQRPVVKPKTLAEFCDFWRMDRSKFYRLQESGRAPATIKVGGTVLVTQEAELEWRRGLSHSVVTCSNTP